MLLLHSRAWQCHTVGIGTTAIWQHLQQCTSHQVTIPTAALSLGLLNIQCHVFLLLAPPPPLRRFWEDYGLWKYDNFRIISDGRCTERSEFLGSGSYIPINASRPVYADQQVCVKEWTDIYSKGGLDAVRARALERVRKMFPLQQIPPPTSDAFYISPNAWHYLVVGATQRGITIEGIKQWALAPFKDPSLCMVGEPYNLIDATWSYAAWKSAIYCLQANYGDVMTPQEKAELSFYLSGCMGANSFPNEIISPTNVSLPGLDPSTGKLGPPTKHFSRVTRP